MAPARPRTSISFKNILLLTDFGPASAGALAYALAFARHFKARLYPAHVMNKVLADSGAAQNEAAIREMEEQKERQLSRLVEYNGVGFQPLLSRCDFETAVSHWIAKHGIDLIVIGTHGRKSAQQFLLGSTSETVLDNALCPVLTIGPQVDVPRLFNLTLDKLLFATGLGRQSQRALAYALALARERHARLTLLHVLPEESRSYHDRTRVLRFTMDELQQLLPPDADDWCKPELAVDAGNPGERIVLHAQSEKPDLIVMGLPRQDPLSVTGSPPCVNHRVVSSAPCPVLSVPEELKE
jgi:nucleotide-binding universal stress UspA family protein